MALMGKREGNEGTVYEKRCSMRHHSTCRSFGRASALLVTSALALSVFVPPASATTGTARVIAGLVDVNTNLAYENAAAAGTGMVLSPGGEVLTNNHVIRGATTIDVRDVDNGKTYSATVVGYDVAADVAVLQLKNASDLKTVPIGNSTSVAVGAKVVAIGNAGGTSGTPSTASGTVTALDQSITASDELTGTSEELTGLIETNAGIEPGDSGGALVNTGGRVVGITTAASSGFEFQPGGNEGFAIPIDTAISLARKIESGSFSGDVHGSATAFLGVDVLSSGYFSAGSFFAGALVGAIVPASPAQAAGLVSGDVITSLGGQSITSPTALTDALLTMSPGEKVQLGWVDAFGTEQSATVTLAHGPPQ